MANTVEPIRGALERNWDMIETAVTELDEAAMASRPNDQSNSVSWLLWHLSRVLDTFIHTRLQGVPQLWAKDGRDEKFGALPDAAEDRGVGWTAEQVAAWTTPAKDVQLAYYQAVKEAVRQYLAEVSEDELSREMVMPPSPEPRSIAACFGQVMWDSLAHGGQIAYLRGLYLGMGWHR